MKNVVFVAPYFLEATERFLLAAATASGARLGVVSCDPEERLPESIRKHISGHFRVEAIDTASLRQGVEAFRRHWGSVDCLLGMLEQIQESLGEIRDQLQIAGMGQATARNFRDKAQMKSVFRRNDIPCAGFGLVDSIAAGKRFAAEAGFPLVAKPPDGAGSKATYRCENLQQLEQCLEAMQPAADRRVLLEQFITGREYSYDSVAIGGQVVWSSISHYAPGPLEVMREPWIQWCVMIPRETHLPEYRHIQQIAPAALQALGIENGLTHMEWFLQPDGSAKISEVAARPPGAQFTTLMSVAHGQDMYRAWARLMIHGQFDPPERKFAAGAAYLRGMGHGVVSRVTGLTEIARELGDLIVEAKMPQLGQKPAGHYEGEGFIVVRHPETRVVEQALARIVNSVRVELKH